MANSNNSNNSISLGGDGDDFIPTINNSVTNDKKIETIKPETKSAPTISLELGGQAGNSEKVEESLPEYVKEAPRKPADIVVEEAKPAPEVTLTPTPKPAAQSKPEPEVVQKTTPLPEQTSPAMTNGEVKKEVSPNPDQTKGSGKSEVETSPKPDQSATKTSSKELTTEEKVIAYLKNPSEIDKKIAEHKQAIEALEELKGKREEFIRVALGTVKHL